MLALFIYASAVFDGVMAQ